MEHSDRSHATQYNVENHFRTSTHNRIGESSAVPVAHISITLDEKIIRMKIRRAQNVCRVLIRRKIILTLWSPFQANFPRAGNTPFCVYSTPRCPWLIYGFHPPRRLHLGFRYSKETMGHSAVKDSLGGEVSTGTFELILTKFNRWLGTHQAVKFQRVVKGWVVKNQEPSTKNHVFW